jgi:hypothetical protein
MRAARNRPCIGGPRHARDELPRHQARDRRRLWPRPLRPWFPAAFSASPSCQPRRPLQSQEPLRRGAGSRARRSARGRSGRRVRDGRLAEEITRSIPRRHTGLRRANPRDRRHDRHVRLDAEVRRYDKVRDLIAQAVKAYATDVPSGAFPVPAEMYSSAPAPAAQRT